MVFLVSLMLALFLPAPVSSFRCDVSDVSLELRDGGVCCQIDLSVSDCSVARNSAVVLQPYMEVDSVRCALIPLAVYAVGRDGGMVDRSKVSPDGGNASGSVAEMSVCAGMYGDRLSLSSVVTGLQSYNHVRILLRRYEMRRGVCVYDGAEVPVAEFTLHPVPVFTPQLFPVPLSVSDGQTKRFAKVVARPRYSADNGLDMSDPVNVRCVSDFVTSVSSLLKSGNTRISSVRMYMYTGMEGLAGKNLSDARIRLQRFRSVPDVQKVFVRRNVQASAEGEDWPMLEEMLSDSFWKRNKEVFDILHDPLLSKDARKESLKKVRGLWDYLRRSVFPDLERIECQIDYLLMPYADDGVRLAVFQSDPRLLSVYDFSCLLASVDFGSNAWVQFALQFAEQYPEVPEASLCAVQAYVFQKKYSDALQFLDRMSDSADVRYMRLVCNVALENWNVVDELLVALDGCDASFIPTVSQARELSARLRDVSPWDKVMLKERKTDVSALRTYSINASTGQISALAD